MPSPTKKSAYGPDNVIYRARTLCKNHNLNPIRKGRLQYFFVYILGDLVYTSIMISYVFSDKLDESLIREISETVENPNKLALSLGLEQTEITRIRNTAESKRDFTQALLQVIN